MKFEVLVDFVDAVHVMRAMQKAYFVQRTPENLRAAKAHEAKVDRMLHELEQPSLFPWHKDEEHA